MELLAAVSGSDIVHVVVWILVAGIVFGILNYVIDYVAAQFPQQPPSPFFKIAKVILVVVAALFLINILLGLVDKPLVKF